MSHFSDCMFSPSITIKPVIISKQLGGLANPVVLKDAPASTNVDVCRLLDYSSDIATQNSVAQI